MATQIKKIMTRAGIFGNEAFVFAFLLLRFVKYDISPDSPLALSLRLAALLAVLALSAVLCGMLMRKTAGAQKIQVTVLLALFLASPASGDVLMLDLWFKDNGTFYYFIALACAVSSFFLIEKSKGKWLLPLLCFAGASLQQVFIFTLLPIPLILIADGIARSADAKEKNEYRDLLASTLVASAIAFILFGVKRAFPGAEDFPALLAEGAKQTAFRCTAVLPLFAVFAVLSILTRRADAGLRGGKTALLIALLPLLGLADPLLAKGTDPDAVMAAVFAQVCLWAYFLYKGSRPFCFAAARIETFFRGNQLLLWLMLIWLAAFSGLGKIMLLGLTKSKSFFHIWQ